MSFGTSPPPSPASGSLLVTFSVKVVAPPNALVTVTVAVTGTSLWLGGHRLFGVTLHATVGGALTVWVTALDVLPLKLASPAYVAVIERVPTVNVDVTNVALPPLSVPVPSVAVPSLNVTVPVGVPPPGGETVTVAVNVTDRPDTDGFCDDAT